MADPDLQIKEGGGHLDPEIRGEGARPQKNFFPPFGPHFGLKIRGGGRAPQAPPLDPPLLGNRIQVSTEISTVKL